MLKSFGQPFSLSETVVDSGQFTHLYEIPFFAGSDSIIEGHYSQLDSLVEFLRINAFAEIELGVHTGFRGNETLNHELSSKRALKLKSYITSKGLSQYRIDAIGFGESKPVLEYEDWTELMDSHRCGYYGKGNRRVTVVITSNKY